MKFLTLADHTGFVEVSLFADAYRRFGHLTTHPGGGRHGDRGTLRQPQGGVVECQLSARLTQRFHCRQEHGRYFRGVVALDDGVAR